MPSGSERRKGRLAPVLAALGATVGVLEFVGAVVWAFLASGGADTIAVGIMTLYVLAGIAVIAGVLAAMVQRLRELKRGEEEDARQY